MISAFGAHLVALSVESSKSGWRMVNLGEACAEPEMPVGRRPEDWPKYKNKMYDKKGRMKMAGSKPLGGSPFSGSEKGEL